MIASVARESKPLPQPVIGLDIGGAHLKLARVDAAGCVTAAMQVPCQLWLGLDRLDQALAEGMAAIAPAGTLALTMTGELADLFPDRATGVVRLVEAIAARFPMARLRLWAGRSGFVAAGEAGVAAAAIASANWLATAALVARAVGEGVLVDLGSTTADILLLAAGEVQAQGLSDRERLASGELVYTGLTRTPLMAVARRAPLAGRWHGLMHEHFATMADVYRVLRLLPEEADQHPAADRGDKSLAGSMRRLARMLGTDLDDAAPEDWQRVAAWFARLQARSLEDAVLLQLSRGLVGERAALIGAGCGRFLIEPVARGLERPYLDLAELIPVVPAARHAAATCAPAVAVALLAAQE